MTVATIQWVVGQPVQGVLTSSAFYFVKDLGEMSRQTMQDSPPTFLVFVTEL
jgi:hypothetical protein